VLGLNELEFSDRLANACIPTSRFIGIASMTSNQIGQQGGDHHYKDTIVPAAPGNKVLRIALRKGSSDAVSQILHVRNVTHETEVENLKNEFLATAAHELRTPMASILGFSEVLLNNEFDEAERHEMTAIIHRQSVLIANIINDLLDLARIEARRGDDFVLETADIYDLVTKSIRDFKAPDDRDSPVVAAASEPLYVKVDCGKFQQALINIISNAYKYSPKGGVVRIDFISKIEQGRQLVGFSVIDHGIGMAVGQLERVFERFYRADTSGQIPGTGLGMNIVKEIIEFHHGRVDVESTVGKGTTVTVLLPRTI
jgi:signal transduction histidine kinase